MVIGALVLVLAVGLACLYARSRSSQDRVDWRIKYLVDPGARLVFRLCGMDGNPRRPFNRATFTRFVPPYTRPTGKFVDRVRSQDLMVPPHDYPRHPHPLLRHISSPSPADVSVRVFEPEVASTDRQLPVMIYIHGGGFTIGSGKDRPMTYVATRFARDGNMVVVSVDYRLAPEHPFPAAIEDCFSVLMWVARRGDGHPALKNVDLTRVITAGDSAGGNLAAVLSLMAIERDAPIRVAYQLLIYPTCICPPTQSTVEFADAYILPRWVSKFFRTQYLKGHDASITEHHYLNPCKAPFLDQAPRTHIVVAELDPLRDEGKLLGEMLKAAGVECEVTQYPNSVHGFVAFTFLRESELLLTHSTTRILQHFSA